MSDEEELPQLYYWCYQCNEWFVMHTPEEFCPKCLGGFVQEICEMDSTPTNSTHFLLQPSADHHEAISFWCLECAESFWKVGGQEEICPYCNGRFVQERSETESESESFMSEDEDSMTISPPPSPEPSLCTTRPSTIDALLTARITEEHVRNNDAECPVCIEECELGSEVKMMPCHHKFHHECISRWLVEQNSCPVCRYLIPPKESEELETETGGGLGRTFLRSMSRRFQFSLWPFSSSGTPST